MRTFFRRFDTYIVGGNLARTSREIFIDITLLGEVEPESVILRSRAQPGNIVLVTGTLGDSVAGLQILLGNVNPGNLKVSPLIKAHLTPEPQILVGQALAKLRCVTAMNDLSDGLAGDITRICESSQVGVEIWADKIPISEVTRRLAEQAGKNPLQWALRGGEDYQLLFATSQQEVERIISFVRQETGVEVTAVGRILRNVEGKRLIREDGMTFPLEFKAWDHFA
jgi:thiamine-monophosphate kinase